MLRALRQILLNFIGNAIKFTEHGAVSVEETVRPESSEKLHRLRIEVTDTGLGMSQEVQRKLFQKFSQAYSSITRQGARSLWRSANSWST